MIVRWHGTKGELLARLHQFGGVFGGKLPDNSGSAAELLQAVGMTLLGEMQDAYEKKAEGGRDAMGIQWAPLAASTLALRRTTGGAAQAAKLRDMFGRLPDTRKRLVAVQYHRLLNLFKAEQRQSRSGAASRKTARRLLELIRPFISPTRYAQTQKRLIEMHNGKAKQAAVLGAYALILRDTGRLFNSLSPQLNGGGDQVMQVGAGSVSVGSNVGYMKFHQSSAPRRMKKDGTPRLPRRQVLPDANTPVPEAWWRRMHETFGRGRRGLRSDQFWRRFLGDKARVA